MAYCCGCTQYYSGTAKKSIQQDALHKQVECKERCTILEWVSNGDGTLDSLYDNDGHSTQYVFADTWWLARLFQTSDYRIGGHEFRNVSRYPQRQYALSPNAVGPFTHSAGIHASDPNQYLIRGPLHTYPTEKGTTFYVEKFHSMWVSDSGSTAELLYVVLKATLPGTDKEVEVLCEINDFDKILQVFPSAPPTLP